MASPSKPYHEWKSLPRQLFQFALEMRKERDVRLAKRFRELTEKRRLTATIREMGALYFDSQDKHPETFMEMFPDLVPKIAERYNMANPPMDNSDELLELVGQLRAELAEARAELKQIKEGIQPGNVVMLQAHNTIRETKQLAANVPIEDDGIELEVITGKTSPVVPLYNLSLKKAIVANGFPLDLPREIIVYGASVIEWKDGATLKRKQWIPHDKLTDQQRQWCIDAGVIQAKGGPKKLANADMEFAPPEFEDMHIELTTAQ